MEFKRKKKRGTSQKVQKMWLSQEGYRIVWRREVFGVHVPAAYQACVRTIVAGNFPDGKTVMWDFVNRKRRLHKTMKAAVTECEQHYKRWSKAIKCTGIRALCEMLGFYPSGIPKWTTNKLNRRLLVTLLDTTPSRRGRINEESEEPEESEGPKEPTSKKPDSKKPDSRKKEGLNVRHRQHLRIRGSTADGSIQQNLRL